MVPDALANNDGGGPFYGVVTFDQVAQGFHTGSRGADFYGVDLKIALIGDAYTGPRSRPAPTVRLRRGSLTGQDVATLTGPESGITSYAWRSYSFRTASGIRLEPNTSYYVVIGSDTQKGQRDRRRENRRRRCAAVHRARLVYGKQAMGARHRPEPVA